uniref:Uncharacterized protein n=1 Tax=Anguilla anguilla TaxID=7936 RepID=A0A0E9X4N1_ANGAN
MYMKIICKKVILERKKITFRKYAFWKYRLVAACINKINQSLNMKTWIHHKYSYLHEYGTVCSGSWKLAVFLHSSCHSFLIMCNT